MSEIPLYLLRGSEGLVFKADRVLGDRASAFTSLPCLALRFEDAGYRVHGSGFRV